MVGGNPETAWLAGLHRDRYLMAGFVLCGLHGGGGRHSVRREPELHDLGGRARARAR